MESDLNAPSSSHKREMGEGKKEGEYVKMRVIFKVFFWHKVLGEKKLEFSSPLNVTFLCTQPSNISFPHEGKPNQHLACATVYSQLCNAAAMTALKLH